MQHKHTISFSRARLLVSVAYARLPWATALRVRRSRIPLASPRCLLEALASRILRPLKCRDEGRPSRPRPDALPQSEADVDANSQHPPQGAFRVGAAAATPGRFRMRSDGPYEFQCQHRTAATDRSNYIECACALPAAPQRARAARAAPAGGGSQKEGGEAEKGGERGRGRGGTPRRDGVQPVLPARCVPALCLCASTVCAQLACAAAIFACRAGRPPARAPHLPLALILAVDQGPIVVGGCGATGGSANRALPRGRDES